MTKLSTPLSLATIAVLSGLLLQSCNAPKSAGTGGAAAEAEQWLQGDVNRWLHTHQRTVENPDDPVAAGIYRADNTRWMGRGAVLNDPRGCDSCGWSAAQIPATAQIKRIDVLVDDWHANFIRIPMISYSEPSQHGAPAPRLSWKSPLFDDYYLKTLQDMIDHIGTKKDVYVLLSLWRDQTLDQETLVPTVDDFDNPGSTCADQALVNARPTTTCMWKKVAERFAKYPYVMFAVDGEPAYNDDGKNDPAIWRAMNAQVQVIRNVEKAMGVPQHLVAVQGTRSWARNLSYYGERLPSGEMQLRPITAEGGTNVLYETHPYAEAREFDGLFGNVSEYLPVIVGEFGPEFTSWEAVRQLVPYMEKRAIPYLGWSFNPKCAVLSMLEETGNTCDGSSVASMQPTEWGAWFRDVLAAGQREAPRDDVAVNLALGRPTRQSSTYGDGIAPRAVDGNTDGNYNNGSVTHTSSDTTEADPFWEVDLGQSADISQIVLWNRTDCCTDRLQGPRVFVSNAPFPSDDPHVLATLPGVAVMDAPLSPNIPATRLKTSVHGRYVRVQVPGYRRVISLAEVQVFGKVATTLKNIALAKPVMQSSVDYEGLPQRAVDGDTEGHYDHRSVTHTQFQDSPFWQVDLQATSHIETIVLYNRTDCCQERWGKQLKVYVSDQPFTSNDPQAVQSTPGVRTYSLADNAALHPDANLPAAVINVHAPGRYVRVQIAGEAQILSLAEVQVYAAAEPLAGALTNAAKGQSASQSSDDYGASAARAVDGDTSGLFWDSSVTHTMDGPRSTAPYWQVDLGRLVDVQAIAVWNRTDCCQDRLLGAQVFVSQAPFASADPWVTAATPGVVSYSLASSANTPLNWLTTATQGRYVRVQLLGDARILSLAEVQIFAAGTSP